MTPCGPYGATHQRLREKLLAESSEVELKVPVPARGVLLNEQFWKDFMAGVRSAGARMPRRCACLRCRLLRRVSRIAYRMQHKTWTTR